MPLDFQMDFTLDFAVIGWGNALLFFLVSLALIMNKIKLEKKVLKLQSQHQQYICKQMVDLRKICHNINTPTNSIIMVLDVLKSKLYGELPYKYLKTVNDADLAIDDLKHNIQDIQNYCDYYVDYNQLPINKLQDKISIKNNNPYVISV